MNTPSKSFNNNNNILSPDLPDLSYLSEDERKIIEAVLERQKAEEEKNLNLLNKKQQHEKSSFDSLKEQQPQLIATTQSITDIAQEAKQKYGLNTIDTGDLCDICKKTKFVSNNNAHACVYCKLKCCIKCSFRLKTKTKVRLMKINFNLLIKKEKFNFLAIMGM